MTRTLERLLWQRPEWWALALSVAAGTWMLAHALESARVCHQLRSLPTEAMHWLLMIVAMMLPLLADPIRTVAFRSFRRRRHVAIATFLGGYLAVWAAAGAPVVWLRGQPWAHGHLAAAVAFALAALWTFAKARERALVGCHHKRALAPSGWPATRDAIAYGSRLGVVCVVSCWPLMVACTITGHAVVAMIGTGALGAFERLSFRPPKRAVALGTLALAAWYFALALLEA